MQQILDGVADISFCNLTSRDVVRHKLVGKIVAAYDQYESTDAVQQAFANPNRATRRAIENGGERR